MLANSLYGFVPDFYNKALRCGIVETMRADVIK